MKTRKLRNIIFALLFCAALAAVPIATKLVPNAIVSGFENRKLALFKAPTAQTLLSGEFASGLETYYKDHIPLRDKFLQADVWLRLTIGKQVINDVVIGDGALLPDNGRPLPTEDAKSKAAAAADKLLLVESATRQAGGRFLVVGAPRQNSALRSKYPYGLSDNGANLDLAETEFFAALAERGIESINMRPIFEQNGGAEQYYYKTDHHYNLRGAYLTYKTACEALGISCIAPESFTYEPVSKLFWGTRSRALYDLSPITDSFEIWRPNEPFEFELWLDGRHTSSELFRWGENDVHIAYSAYMGGDWGETVLKTDRVGLPKILILGDSFTNAAETFFAATCSELRSLDLRYGDVCVSEYISEFKPDVVIMIINDNAYLKPSDDNFAKIS